MTRRILLGAVAGLLSALGSLAVAYVVGVVVVAFVVRDIWPTVLTATTVLPLLLLFVILIPALVIGLVTGVTIGVAANYTSRVYLVGGVTGLVFGVFVLSGVLPLILDTESDEFSLIVTRPFWTTLFALFLGLLASRFFRWFD